MLHVEYYVPIELIILLFHYVHYDFFKNTYSYLFMYGWSNITTTVATDAINYKKKETILLLNI